VVVLLPFLWVTTCTLVSCSSITIVAGVLLSWVLVSLHRNDST